MHEKRSEARPAGFPAVDPARVAVILVRPETPENVGIAARGLANTGYRDLRIVGPASLAAKARVTAVHAERILEGASFHDRLEDALRGLNVTFGSTARRERGFPLLSLDQAVGRIHEYPSEARIGLVFGNERTGLTAEEMGLTNYRFHIPQAARQPSYNLGVAVTLVMFALASSKAPAVEASSGRDLPLSHEEQIEAGRKFRDFLDHLGFMRSTNREFISAKVEDIFMRMAMTPKDRDIIQAMFRKAVLAQGGKTGREGKKKNAGKESSSCPTTK